MTRRAKSEIVRQSRALWGIVGKRPVSHFGERFGQLIRRKREDRGWSFAQVAIAVYGDDGQGGETRKSDVQKLEKGTTRKPNARTIKLFREALDLTQAEIDACRSAAELELARYAERLFTVMQGAVAKAGVSPDLARDLADRYAEGNPDSFDTALRELARAVEVAAEQHARGALPSNSDEQVDRIIAEVERLNIEESIGAGSDYIRRALAASRDRIAEQQAAHLRLIETGLAQAVLNRSVDDAATLELERWRLDGGGFGDLRKVQDGWYERGRDKGLAFDLQVSIALAGASEDHARNADDRGAALNDLGVALLTLGERESGTARLEQAVAAFRAALQEFTHNRVPRNWATTQNNLGNALGTLGARESGTTRLEEAVTAYRAALEERTRDLVPLDWAMTQTNLGTALLTLGEREGGIERLDQAVAACRAALEERTRDRVPLDWAGTTYILGYTEALIGGRMADRGRVLAGIARIESAIPVLEDGRHEVWARGARNNLAKARAILDGLPGA
jgi:tetratricopeptide (TPR) repeat protein